MTRDFVTIVSGAPRSGTSMMMRMLADGGIPPLTDGVRQPVKKVAARRPPMTSWRKAMTAS